MQNTKTTFRENNRMLIKGLFVGFLILAMLIPCKFLEQLVQERQSRQEDVVNEVSGKWGGPQTIMGPILLLPYKVPEKGPDGSAVYRTHIAYILPDELLVTGNINPTEKKRSLYSVLLFHSGLALTGKFSRLPLQELHIDPATVAWQDARLVMNVGDMGGIEDEVQLDWNGTMQLMDAGVPENQLLKEGLSTPVAINAENAATFSVNLNLRGSDHLYFTPVGKVTDVTITANWKNPSFDGAYLPENSELTGKSFKAHWKILPLSHNFPHYWTDNSQDLARTAFGVKLIQPVDGYTKTNRSVKYALLFIALTFTIFFFLEVLQKRRVHPLQYILVGVALTIFYTLLLSVSEYTGFNIAYFIASAATVSLIGFYTGSIFKSLKTALGFTAALTTLYAYIFVLIQLEDYALLCGSIGLFVIIAIVMYYSRKVDWYGMQNPDMQGEKDSDDSRVLGTENT